jgi:hypothetical protein
MSFKTNRYQYEHHSLCIILKINSVFMVYQLDEHQVIHLNKK